MTRAANSDPRSNSIAASAVNGCESAPAVQPMTGSSCLIWSPPRRRVLCGPRARPPKGRARIGGARTPPRVVESVALCRDRDLLLLALVGVLLARVAVRGLGQLHEL